MLQTSRSDYLVVACRLMATRDGVKRWALAAVRYDHDQAPVSGNRLGLRWHRRNRRK